MTNDSEIQKLIDSFSQTPTVAGFGDFLMLSAFARGWRIKNPNGPKLLFRGRKGEMVFGDMFRGNKTVINHLNEITDFHNIQVIDLQDPHFWYMRQKSFRNPQTKIRRKVATYPTDIHAVTKMCRRWKVPCPQLGGEVFLTNEEESKIKKILERLPDKFSLVLPQQKVSYKHYSRDKFKQIIVATPEYNWIQIGPESGELIVPEKRSLVGQLTVRELTGIVAQAQLTLSVEGMLGHMAGSVSTASLQLISHTVPPIHIKYLKGDFVQYNPPHICYKGCSDGSRFLAETPPEMVIDTLKEKFPISE